MRRAVPGRSIVGDHQGMNGGSPMKLPGLGPRRSRLLALGVLLFPPLLWTFVLAVVPTDSARRTITARLSASSGRTVHIGGIRVGWLGAVSLTDLRIGASDSGDDPWLKVRRASIDVSLRQLVLGRVDPTEIDVAGLSLRVLRREDGSLVRAGAALASGEAVNIKFGDDVTRKAVVDGDGSGAAPQKAARPRGKAPSPAQGDLF